MPSTSKKQHNFMMAVAHSPSFAKKAGVPQSVGKEFSKADKGRKFAKGGDMAESKAMVKKEIAFMKKKGAPASMIKHEKEEAGGKFARGGGIESKGKTKGEMIKMARGGGVEIKGKTKGSMVKMAGARRFAEGGSVNEDQEAADKAAGLAESNKEKPVGFLERLRMGNIDQPGSEAYKRFGAGRGAASRAAKVPVEDAVPAKVSRAPEPSMGEDERPAPTGMGAIAQMAPTRPAVRPSVTAAKVAPTATAAATAAPARAVGAGKPKVDELEEYAASRRQSAAPAAGTGRKGGATAEELEEYQKTKTRKEVFTPPSEADIQKGMEAAAAMLPGGASLKAIRELAKKLAGSGKLADLKKIARARFAKDETPRIGNKSAASEAPYLKELGYTPPKIGSEPLKVGMKKGGNVKKMATGGSVQKASPASKRGDGIATKGKTRGKMC